MCQARIAQKSFEFSVDCSFHLYQSTYVFLYHYHVQYEAARLRLKYGKVVFFYVEDLVLLNSVFKHIINLTLYEIYQTTLLRFPFWFLHNRLTHQHLITSSFDTLQIKWFTSKTVFKTFVIFKPQFFKSLQFVTLRMLFIKLVCFATKELRSG